MAKLGPCLCSFILGFSILIVPFLASSWDALNALYINYSIYLLIVNVLFVNCSVLLVYRGYDYQIFWRGHLLGVTFALGLLLAQSSYMIRLFGWYASTLAFFHWSEYVATALTNPNNLGLQSYLLDHSTAYHCALVASTAEFALEAYCWPALKQPGWLNVVGLAIVICGEILRKAAMFTARSNFNHHVRYVRDDAHKLVTHGVFSVVRHPAYVGWFYWSIGSQVMIANPFCAVAYCAASWTFFKSRVESEELTLLYFFGEDYVKYQRRVGTGLPFICGSLPSNSS